MGTKPRIIVIEVSKGMVVQVRTNSKASNIPSVFVVDRDSIDRGDEAPEKDLGSILKTGWILY